MTSPRHLPLCSLLLLLSLLALFPYECMGADADCVPHQRNLLLQLKLGFNVFPPGDLDSWRAGSNCCNWEGVACDSVSGLITELDLGGLNISGEIDSSLFKLASLQKLSLAHNNFNQSLPNEFGLLSNLVSLNLSRAGFFGQIPVGISRLANLATLDLSASPPYLSASDGQLTGRIPTWIANLTQLSFLDLSNNNFNGSIPSVLPPRIASLYLRWNQLSGQLQGFSNGSSQLEVVDLRYNMLRGELPRLIRDLHNLRELYLDRANISASGRHWSAAVARWTPKLRVLSLEGCSITGPFDPSLSKLGDLSVLRLGENDLNCSVPEFFGNFSSLTELDLGLCGLNGTFPKKVFLLKNLTYVYLSFNSMLSGSLPEFAIETKLESLFLAGTNFSGQFPRSPGKLKSLIDLDLSDCQFSGTIPTSIANLTQLSSLDLSYNNFNGSIPSSLFLLSALQYMYLSGNQLSGQLQAGFSNGSSQLEEVYLDHNMLQGELQRFVFQLPRLSSFSAASNNFSGEVRLGQFGVLPNLEFLDLSYSGLSIKDDGDNNSLPLPKFGVLKLASCNLTRVPSFLRYQDEIAIIDLSNNKIHGAIPSWIWSFGDGLQVLNLAGNFFTSLEPFLLDSNLSFPIVLDLHSNLLRGPIQLLDSNISSYMIKTTFLSLANNNLTGEIPPSICNTTALEFLDLSGNHFTGTIPPCLFGGNNSLEVLKLQGNELRGHIPPHIGKGCGLRSLHLNGNHLGGQLPDSLVNCDQLEVIDIGNNRIRDSFPFWLTRIPSLRVIVLRSNEFYGPIELPSSTYAASFSLPSLQIFDVSSNSFNGSLPLHFFMRLEGMMAPSGRTPSLVLGYYYRWAIYPGATYYQDTVTVTSKGSDRELAKILTIYTSIDLSNNAFTGDIPVFFGKLQALHSLNLSRNSLAGQIPLAFESMKQLESLDLSENHLSGEIPQELASLTFLSVLNLSCNDLVGRIPQGNQFSTFPNSSFGGNEGLCGFPLSKQCLNVTPTIIEQTDPASESDPGYAIVVALCTGIGYGVGIAVVLVLPNLSWGRNISPLVSRALASIGAWTRRAATNARKKLMKATEETAPRTRGSA